MDVETAIRAFASAGHDLPREAMRWALDNWDEAAPGHPLATGEAYARAIDGAELVVEEEGKSPLAWQGGQLSKVIAALADRAFPR